MPSGSLSCNSTHRQQHAAWIYIYISFYTLCIFASWHSGSTCENAEGNSPTQTLSVGLNFSKWALLILFTDNKHLARFFLTASYAPAVQFAENSWHLIVTNRILFWRLVFMCKRKSVLRAAGKDKSGFFTKYVIFGGLPQVRAGLIIPKKRRALLIWRML